MTVGWALITVAILFLMHKYQLLGRALRVITTITVLVVIGLLGWIGWSHFDASWSEHKSRVRFAQMNDCLDLSTGMLHPLIQAGPPWCRPNEVTHKRGEPIDQWAVTGDMPSIPSGEYFAINGETNPDGIGSFTPARLCVNSDGVQRCFTPTSTRHIFGENAKAEEVKLSSGGRLILFTAEDGSGHDISTLIALLANRKGEITNLLPIIDDPMQFRLWNLPNISELPVLVTASYIWGNDIGECRACPHRYEISTYVYSRRVGGYVRGATFMTAIKYSSDSNVTELERVRVLAELESSSKAEAARHLIIKP